MVPMTLWSFELLDVICAVEASVYDYKCCKNAVVLVLLVEYGYSGYGGHVPHHRAVVYRYIALLVTASKKLVSLFSPFV